MRTRLSTQLRNLVTAPAAATPPAEAPLSPEARRVARVLRMEAERATKGRACRYEAAGEGLVALLEGRDAEAVARQVARRFEAEAAWRATVARDRGGASVVLSTVEAT